MIQIAIDPTRTLPPFKKLHGMNLAAPIAAARRCRKVSEYLTALEIPQTRMHDCPLNNPGKALVDMNCIFPLPHADPGDPRNYRFAETDDYFANTLQCRTTIMYRLGVSIDHSGFAHHTRPPADPIRWAEVAAHIIRHYNEGWADGFHHDIRYWEIWNEADTELPILWDGSWAEFIAFYITAAKRLKAQFPELKIGGPSMAKLTTRNGRAVREFLGGCREAGAPLDFFSYHQYSDKPEKIAASPREARRLLDEYGFEVCEVHLSEWHYHPGWGSDCDVARERFLHREMTGPHSAAYIVATLLRWQDEPIDMAHYYTGSTGRGYALFDDYGEPYCGYYAFDFFQRLARQKRIAAGSDHPGVTVAAGESGDGIRVLAACCKTEQNELAFEFADRVLQPERCRVALIDIDGVKRELNGEVAVSGNRLIFEKASGSMVAWLEILN